MTACICRRFIPTTAFLIAYVSGQYRTTRTRYKVCWFIHQVEFEGQDGWKCFFFSYGCSRLTEKWKRTWENQLLLSAGKCRQRWHCVHCGMEDIWRVLLLWLVIFWVLCAKVVGATSVWVFFGVSQKWLCLAITQTYTESILTIFGKMFLRKYAIKWYFIFPPHLTSASALPGEMNRDKNSILSLNAVLLHCHTSTSRWLNLVSLVTCNSCSCCYMTLQISNLIVSGVKLWTVIGP